LQNGRGGSNSKDARIKCDAEPSWVTSSIHIRHCCEVERAVEELVKVSTNKRVGVEVDQTVDAQLVKRPYIKLRVLIFETMVYASTIMGRGYKWNRMWFPPDGTSEAESFGGDAVFEVWENQPGARVRGACGMPHDGYSDCKGI
jgi:hypothetical protein